MLSKVNIWLDNFFAATAWKMTPPAAYGPFHLTFAFVGLGLCLLLAWKFRNLSEKGNRVLLMSCGVFLIATEIYKQLFYYYFIGSHTYQWWIFPFQMCSVPMYLCVIAPLLKHGKVQRGMYNFMMIYNLLGGFMAFVEPSGIIHSYWTLTLHAFIWHMVLVFVGLYLAISNRGGKTITDYKSASVTFVILCAVAFCINVALRKVSGGSVNMFFVGPSNSSLAVFKDISKHFGWYISTLLYIPTVCLGAYIIFLPMHLLAKRKEKIST